MYTVYTSIRSHIPNLSKCELACRLQYYCPKVSSHKEQEKKKSAGQKKSESNSNNIAPLCCYCYSCGLHYSHRIKVNSCSHVPTSSRMSSQNDESCTSSK